MIASELMSDTLPSVPPSQSTVRRKAFPRVLLIILVGVIAIIVTWFNPLSAQKRNLLAAQRQADSIAPLIHADARFQNIRVLTFTGMGGCLQIHGKVNSKQDAEALRALVASTKPPVRTWFTIFIHTAGSDKPEVTQLPDLLTSEPDAGK